MGVQLKKNCRPSKKGILEYLTFLRKPQAILQMSADMATKHCKKRELNYRFCTTLEVKGYLFGLINLVKVQYYY